MDLRRTILLAAGLALASRAGAQGTADDKQEQQPPSDRSQQSWYQKDAQKAGELGKKGADATRRGATAAGKKVNEGGQAATAKVVGTKTVTGKIADVSGDRVTVKRSDGTPLDLRVTDSTKVTVGGHAGAVGALRQGDEVRASYAQSGGSATAMKIDVRRSAGAAPGSRERAPGATGTGGAAPGSPSR
jgi:hypothetical protein